MNIETNESLNKQTSSSIRIAQSSNCEDSQRRGRQLLIASKGANGSKTTTCESLVRSNKFLSENATRKDNMTISSDYSLDKNKEHKSRKKLEIRKSRTLKRTRNVLQRKYENDSSISMSPECRGKKTCSPSPIQSDSMLIESSHYNIKNEIEQIMNDVYNAQIYNARIPLDIFNKYTKYIAGVCKLNDREFVYYLLNLVSEKIADFMKKAVEKILDQEAVRAYKEQFYEIITKYLVLLEKNEKRKKKKKTKKKKVQNLVLNNNKLLYEYFQFFHDKEEVVSFILKKLSYLYYAFGTAILLIQNIFKPAFDLINEEYNIDLTSEVIHKDEYLNCIKSEDFLSAIIIQINCRENYIKDTEFIEIFKFLENESEKNKEITKMMREVLNRELKVIDSERENDLDVARIHSEEPTLSETENEIDYVEEEECSNLKIEKTLLNDIDDIYNYIISPDEKKNGQKNKKQKKPNKKQNLIKNQKDPVLEEFKEYLTKNTAHARCVNKIKPCISKEYILTLAKQLGY